MYKKDHDEARGTDRQTKCPITREPCMERECEWWRRTDPERFESCVIWDIAAQLTNVYFSLR